MFFPSKIWFLFIVFLKIIKGQGPFPKTPCKSVFNYKIKDVTNEVYGYLKFTNDFSGDYQLEVRMSVGRKVHGNISILRVPTEEQIQCGSDLEYEVSFPPCDGLIPAVTFVKFNSKIFCTGPPIKDIYGRGMSQLAEVDGLVTNMHGNDCETMTDHPPLQGTNMAPQRTINQTNEEDGCGILREINGREHFPWLTTLYQRGRNISTSFRCSGTLLSKSHIVTVAHCLTQVNQSDIVIRLGRNNIKEIVPSTKTTIRSVKTIYIHPTYISDDNHRVSGGNIAIIEMDHPVEYSDVIRPACLWNSSDNLTEVVHQQAIVIGWGADAKPKKFTMPIVSHADCLKSNDAHTKGLLEPTSFCAGNLDGVVPCTGNSGGSLLLLRDGRYYLRGLTSTIIGANCDQYSSILFTDVAMFVSWISYIVGD